MQEILLVCIGAILGANARFILYKKLEKSHLNKEYIVLIINALASFFLGFVFSIINQFSYFNLSNQLVIFLSIGFLGSLSTFSTFVFDLYDLLLRFKFLRAFKLYIFSLGMGVIALALGFFFGTQ